MWPTVSNREKVMGSCENNSITNYNLPHRIVVKKGCVKGCGPRIICTT